MSALHSSPIPSGWYPDPYGETRQRWWDGSAWTSSVAPFASASQSESAQPTTATEPDQATSPVLSLVPELVPAVGGPLAAASVSRRSARNSGQAAATVAVLSAAPLFPASLSAAPLFPASLSAASLSAAPLSVPQRREPASTSALVPMQPATTAYQPFGISPLIKAGVRSAPTQGHTSAAWLIALMPAVLFAAAAAIIEYLPALYTPFTQGALLVVVVVATIALAANDRRELTFAGHTTTTSPALVLLTPLVYLIVRAARARRQSGTGAAPAWLCLAVVVSLAVAATLQPSLITLFLSTSAL